ncbi:MAG: twin-arginine translocation signal domain-containing protein, partial [Thiobacillus sp.]
METKDKSDQATGVTEAVPARRQFLKATAVAGAAAVVSAPFISNAHAAAGQTWKVQSVWDAGTTGYGLFEA